MHEYLTSIEQIRKICQHIKIKFKKITNVYHLGSRIHKSNRTDSDYDLLIVGKFKQNPLKFIMTYSRHPYFYHFTKIPPFVVDGRIYDVSYLSNENFEKLLGLNYLLFVEALFSEKKFRPICKKGYEYKEKYLEKLNDREKLRAELANSLRHERSYARRSFTRYKQAKSGKGKKREKDILTGWWLLKKTFHALRYCHSVFDFLHNKNFSTFGSMNEKRKNIVSRLEKEGDQCVVEIYHELYNELQNIFNIIKIVNWNF